MSNSVAAVVTNCCTLEVKPISFSATEGRFSSSLRFDAMNVVYSLLFIYNLPAVVANGIRKAIIFSL